MWSISWWYIFSYIDKDEHLIEKTITLSLTIVTLFWFLLWNWNKPRNPKSPLPPGPRGLPLLGYLPFLGPSLHHQFTELSKLYGPICKLKLGTKLCFVISSPSLVKQIVRDQETNFANRDQTVVTRLATYGGSDIAFGSYGPQWRRLRKVFVSQMLSKANLDASYAFRKQEAHKSIAQIYAKVGTPIDVGQFSFWTSSNTIMRMLWGGTVEADHVVGEEFRSRVGEMTEFIGKANISDFFPILARFDVQGIERRAKKLHSETEKLFKVVIEQQMNSENQKDDNESKGFLQLLLKHNKDNGDGSESLSLQQVIAMLTDIVVGGTDTTATIVEWAMAELMKHPNDMKKVQEELKQVVGLNNLVEESHLPKLHYLDAVIKETNRLHPALPLLVPHCPSQSTTIGGYNVPKGSTIYLNIWAIQRDPSLWENPLEFRPGRFLNGGDPSNNFDYKGNKFEYLPFGSGRRICAGIPLAERMLVYQLASFLHSFEWRLPDEAKLDLQDKFGIVTKKMTPLVAIPTPRLSNLELYI